MANEKISELPSGLPAQPGDAVPIARAGSNYSLAASAIAALAPPTIIAQVSGNTAGVTAIISSGTLVLAGGSNVTLSQNGNSISFNATGGIAASLAGNTAGALAVVSTGTLVLAGGNNVTLSQNGNSVTISANTAVAANLSVSAGTTTGAFGGLTFGNANDVSFGLNNGTITATVTYPTTAAYYFGGNTTGQSSSSTALDQSLSISAAGIISGGWTNGSLVFSATQSVQTQASGNIGATGFATTTTNGSVIVGTNNTTGFTLAVPPYLTTQTVQTQASGNIAATGFATTTTNGSVIVGTNNTTGLTLAVPPYLTTQSVQTQASGNIAGIGVTTTTQAGSTLGATLNTTGLSLAIPLWATSAGVDVTLGGNTSGALALVSTGTLFLAGGNNVTLSQNGNSVTISANTVAAANLSISAGTTSGAFGGVTFSNSNNVTFGLNNGTITATVPTQSNQSMNIYASSQTTAQSSSANFDARSITVVGAGNVSVGFSVGNLMISGATVAGLTTGGAYVQGNTTGQSSSSTYAVTSFNVSAAGLISAGWSNSTLIISAPNTTGISQSLYATGNTTQSSSGTASIGSILFEGAGNVSVGVSNGSVVIAGAGGVDVSLAGNSTSAGAGYVLISTGTFFLAGGNNVTLSQNGNAVTISAGTAAAASLSVSAGTTSGTFGGLTFSNSNNVSFGLNNGTITATATFAGGGAAVGMSTFGNTAGTTHTFNSGTYVLVGTGPVSLSQSTNANGATLSINAPATSSLSATGWASISVNGSTISIGAAAPQLSFFQPLGVMQSTTVTQNGIGSIQVYPAIAAFPFTATRVDMMASVSAAALAVSTEAQTLSMYVGLYSLNGSTLSLASSGSQSYAWTNSSGGSSSVITGLRRFSAPINVNYTGGFDLFVGVMSNTTFVNTNGISLSNVVMPVAPGAQLNGLIGQATANSLQFVPGQGFFSATSAGMPSSMGLSAIFGIGSVSNNALAAPVQFVNVTA